MMGTLTRGTGARPARLSPAISAVGLGGRILPRWLTWVGLLAGFTALVDGTMLGSETAWGFLLGIIWVFADGMVLALRALPPLGHGRAAAG